MLLHLTRDHPPPGIGGLSTAIGGLARAFEETGRPCAVVSFDAWRPSRRDPNATTPEWIEGPWREHLLRLTDVGQLEAARDVAASLEPAPNAVVIHDPLFWEWGEELARSWDAKTVAFVHVLHAAMNRLREVDRPTLSLEAQLVALKRADRVLAPSRAAADLLLVDHPEVVDKLGVALLGVHDSAEARAVVESETRATSTTVLHVGRFGDVKGTDLLGEVARRVLAAREDVVFEVAGGLPESGKRERRWWRRLLEAFPEDQRDRFRFLGWLDEEELRATHARAACFLAPSRIETLGLALTEARLLGTPVVTTDIPAFTQQVEHEVTGLIGSTGSPDGLAELVFATLDDRDAAMRRARAAAERVRRDHDWSRLVAVHESLGRLG